MTRQAVLSGLLALLGACVVQKPGVLDAGNDDGATSGDPGEEEEEEADSADDDAPDPETDTPMPEPEPPPAPTDGDGCAEKLDILVVIDDSGSMGDSQRQLTDAFPLLIDGLDQAGVDWRVAFTTTDNGNMLCAPGTNPPEHGGFVLSSCTTRLDDFIFADQADMQDLACNDVCTLSPAQLETLPTTTALDPNPQPRPWLQRQNGHLNLAEGVAVSDALRCLLPQGINGCGFEQPLESMRLALARTTNPMAPEAGFMRDDASLLVLLVTDEVDCSIRPELEEAVLSPDGNRAFWSNPDDSLPTSAVCWNAGVECLGDPSNYDDCVPANKDVMGSPAATGESVLYPVTRYQYVLAQIEQSKRAIHDGLDVAVLSLHGVGLDGNLHYADVSQSNPDFQLNFGIGPGCVRDNGPEEPTTAVPPVRIRALAEHMSSDPLGSICEQSFDDFMLATLDRFVGGC